MVLHIYNIFLVCNLLLFYWISLTAVLEKIYFYQVGQQLNNWKYTDFNKSGTIAWLTCQRNNVLYYYNHRKCVQVIFGLLVSSYHYNCYILSAVTKIKVYYNYKETTLNTFRLNFYISLKIYTNNMKTKYKSLMKFRLLVQSCKIEKLCSREWYPPGNVRTKKFALESDTKVYDRAAPIITYSILLNQESGSKCFLHVSLQRSSSRFSHHSAFQFPLFTFFSFNKSVVTFLIKKNWYVLQVKGVRFTYKFLILVLHYELHGTISSFNSENS